MKWKCLKCDGELHPILKDGHSYVQCDKCGRLFTRHDLKNHTPGPQPQTSQPVKAAPNRDDGDRPHTMGIPTAVIGWILCTLFIICGLGTGGIAPAAFIIAAVLVSPVFRNRVHISGKVWIPLVIVLFVAGFTAAPQPDTGSKQIAEKQNAPTPAPKQIKASAKKQEKEDTAEQQAAAEKEKAERAAQEQAEREEQERIAQEQAAAQAEQERIAQEQAAAQQAEQERIAQEQAAAQAEQERIAQEQAAAQAEQERIAQEQAAAQAEQQRLEQERIAQEQAAAQQAEQERIAQEQAAAAQIAQTSNVWLSATGQKYHSIPNCGRMDPANARQVSLTDAQRLGIEPCKNCH